MCPVHVPTLDLIRPEPRAGEVEEIWLARGLHKRWRVISESRTFGEFDEYADAVQFQTLLVIGNDHLEVLT